jgi:hypothetical protein
MTYAIKLPEFDIDTNTFIAVIGRPPKSNKEFTQFCSSYENLMWNKIRLDEWDEEWLQSEVDG